MENHSTMIISGVATLMMVIVAWTNYRQHLLSKEKFKLDMFEKRFAVYKATQRFLTKIMQAAKVEVDDVFEFRRGTQDATFLFKRDIEEYIRKIDAKSLDLRSAEMSYTDVPHGEERNKLVKCESDLLKELLSELPKLKDIFAPYLRFDRWK